MPNNDITNDSIDNVGEIKISSDVITVIAHTVASEIEIGRAHV